MGDTRFASKVTVTTGRLQGIDDRHDTVSWRGIPFAAPPVGDRRWKAPRDAAPWDGVREAREYGPVPWQFRVPGASEDCLYLNVWRPAHGREGLPVYVWIPGGGNQVQMPSLPQTPGSLLAARSDVVVVTVPYRLNNLGWFTHPTLREDRDPLDDSGNYGTLDIIKALQWIRANIMAFGGDPDNVLVTGESAGAYNTLSLLISPAARGLFHKAMAQSGRQDTHTMAEADERGEAILASLLDRTGMSRPRSDGEIAAFLRQTSPEDLSAAARSVRFFAGYRDGAVIHPAGFGALDDGTYPNKVPAIIGMNKEEAKFQLSRRRELFDDREQYEAMARQASLDKRTTGCDDLLRRLRANADQPPVYGYEFLWGWDGGDHPSPLPEPLNWQLGAAHGMDIAFFLHGGGRTGANGDGRYSEENRPGREALAAAMMGYLRNFAHTGMPSSPHAGGPEWEPWSNEDGGPKLINFDADLERTHIRMAQDELTPVTR